MRRTSVSVPARAWRPLRAWREQRAGRRGSVPARSAGGTGRILWLALALVTWLLSTHALDIARALDARWIVKYPSAWRIDVQDRLSAFMSWLVDDARLGPIAFAELTRALAWLIEQPYALARALFAGGLVSGVGSDAIELLPPLPWLAVVVGVAALGHHAGGWRLALLTGLAFLYLAVFGQWEEPPEGYSTEALQQRLDYGYALGHRNDFLDRYYRMPGTHGRVLAAVDVLRGGALTDWLNMRDGSGSTAFSTLDAALRDAANEHEMMDAGARMHRWIEGNARED